MMEGPKIEPERLQRCSPEGTLMDAIVITLIVVAAIVVALGFGGRGGF